MSSKRGKKTCDCGSGEFIFVKDLNLAKVWKSGNKFARICTACGNRYFLGKAMWENATDQYVILDGEDEPVPIFDCPACEETVTGWPDSCPYCDVPYEWNEAEKIDIGGGTEPADEPVEDESDDDGLIPLDELEEEQVDKMGYTMLQKYGAAVEGMKGSGVDEATLRAQLKERLPGTDVEDNEDAETEDTNDATA